MAKVFVYGSLKQGFYNHSVLYGATYLGDHNTDKEFKMLDLGSYPAVVNSPECGFSIYGEVYEVDQEGLDRLDHLEEYPAYYNRKTITTPYGEAWIYFIEDSSTYENSVVHSGNWGT